MTKKKSEQAPAVEKAAEPKVAPKAAAKLKAAPEKKLPHRVVHGGVKYGKARLGFGDELELTESEAAHMNKGASREDRPVVLLAEDFDELEKKKEIESNLAKKKAKSKKKAEQDEEEAEASGPAPG